VKQLKQAGPHFSFPILQLSVQICVHPWRKAFACIREFTAPNSIESTAVSHRFALICTDKTDEQRGRFLRMKRGQKVTDWGRGVELSVKSSASHIAPGSSYQQERFVS
jgi:hypothetical protein